MPAERVEIIYEASVRGADQIKDLSNKTKELGESNDEIAPKINRAAAAQEKQKDTMLKARAAIQQFRREIFALTTVVSTIYALSQSSDRLASTLEKAGDTIRDNFLGPLGNGVDALLEKFVAFPARVAGALSVLGIGNFKQALQIANQTKTSDEDKKTRAQQIQDLNIFAQTAKAKGQDLISQEKDQQARRIKILGDANKERRDLLAQQLNDLDAAEKKALQLQQLGLKNQLQVFNDFKKDLVGVFRGGVGETLFNLFEGNAQSGSEVLKNFTTGISRALSDAISQSLSTTIFGGGFSGGLMSGFSNLWTNFKNILSGKNPTTQAIEDMHQTLKNATDCICRTADNTSNIGNSNLRYEGIITPAGASALQKIGSITSLVGAVAGAGAFAGGLSGGGIPTPGAGGDIPLPPGAGITMAPPPLHHTGGFVRAYSTGGEVPITAQGGEFVVRKSVAMANKDFLTDFNLHGNVKKSKNAGGGNVFIIKANDAASFDRQLSTPSGRAQIETQVIRAIMSNGNIRQVIKNFT